MRRRLKDAGDDNQKIALYENKISLLSQEIERLNAGIRSKVDENNNLEGRLRGIQQELDGSRRAISEYEFKFTQVTQEYQLKISNY